MVRPTGVEEARKSNDLGCPTGLTPTIENITLFQEKSNQNLPAGIEKESAARSSDSGSVGNYKSRNVGRCNPNRACRTLQAFRSARRLETDLMLERIEGYVAEILRDIRELTDMPNLRRSDLVAMCIEQERDFRNILRWIREGRI